MSTPARSASAVAWSAPSSRNRAAIREHPFDNPAPEWWELRARAANSPKPGAWASSRHARSASTPRDRRLAVLRHAAQELVVATAAAARAGLRPADTHATNSSRSAAVSSGLGVGASFATHHRQSRPAGPARAHAAHRDPTPRRPAFSAGPSRDAGRPRVRERAQRMRKELTMSMSGLSE